MNYIAEIKAFYDWLPFNSIPADAQALWHTLMYLNNKCAVCVAGEWYWRVEFSVSIQTLLSYLGFSRTQLDRMRNVLIQSGRIRYRKGKGSQSGVYQMIPFDEHNVAQPVTQSNETHNVAQNVTQPVTQPGTLLWHNLLHNRCILNNNNINNTGNIFSSGGDGARAAAESAVAEYLQDRDLDIFDYFGATEETLQTVSAYTDVIFARFARRQPTETDRMNVFHALRTSEQDECSGKWRISFPRDKIDLLMYAFEQAAMSGKPADWKYTNAILDRLAQRGIQTLNQAEEYDIRRDIARNGGQT